MRVKTSLANTQTSLVQISSTFLARNTNGLFYENFFLSLNFCNFNFQGGMFFHSRLALKLFSHISNFAGTKEICLQYNQISKPCKYQ